MRVLVCGSRAWRSSAPIAMELYKLPMGTVVMHGGAHGADRIAARVAEGFDFETEEWPADWKRYGRRAGIKRNLTMLDEKPDLVLAFWDGKSRGTKHTITEAKRRGIPVRVHFTASVPADLRQKVAEKWQGTLKDWP